MDICQSELEVLCNNCLPKCISCINVFEPCPEDIRKLFVEVWDKEV